MEKNHFLFCPGPVMVSDRLRKALLHPDMCHRVPAFEDCIQNIQKNLLKIYKADDDYTVLLITGSGTAANETVVSSYFSPQDKVLLIKNGEFGERLEELLAIHEVATTTIGYDWGTPVNPLDIENRLRQDPAITAIMMVFHETSTSMVNPVSAIGDLAARHGKHFVVDGVSAVGGEDVDMVRDHIDICTCSSNKCLASLPGVGIICARRSELDRTRNNRTRVAYLNLHRLYKMSETLHQTPNTPSVTMFMALEAAVERLLDEGLENQISRHQRCARIIRDGVRKMGLKLLIPDDRAANTVTSVFLPTSVRLEAFIDAMERRGFTLYPGKGILKEKNMFQIANMGEVNEEMCSHLLKAMAEIIEALQNGH